MHVLFEVLLAPGASGEGLFTRETLDDTAAQVMTVAEAERIGLSGIPEAPEGQDRLLVVVAKIDERRIQNVLEASGQVAGFRVHLVDL